MLALFFTQHLAGAQAATPVPSYTDIVKMYRAGAFADAVAALQRLGPRDIELGVKGLRTSSVDRVRAAVMLHTEAAMAARRRQDVEGWTRHHDIAASLIASIEGERAGKEVWRDPAPAAPAGALGEHGARPPSGSFVRTWRLLVIAVHESYGNVQHAVTAGAIARQRGGDTAELLLAVGAAQEMGWAWRHDGDRASPLGDLALAEELYRKALVLDGTLLEVRVRLGRVLMLRGDIEASLGLLRPIGAGDEASYVYLARLFEGDALERSGRLDEAARAYADAAGAMPRAQSAAIAAAYLRHADGRRPAAASRIQATMADSEPLDAAADPWYWYTRGTAWREAGYLATLRDQVTKSGEAVRH